MTVPLDFLLSLRGVLLTHLGRKSGQPSPPALGAFANVRLTLLGRFSLFFCFTVISGFVYGACFGASRQSSFFLISNRPFRES